MSYPPPPAGYDMIFVFGSNEAGRHGSGAARYAYDHHGAEWGVGEGRTGRSYALPTKDHLIRTRPLSKIWTSIEKFLEYARTNPELKFQLTAIGCGLAELDVRQIAPRFEEAPANVYFPPEFRRELREFGKERFWK